MDVFHSDAPRGSDYVQAAADAAYEAHVLDKQHGGAILIFMPGAREVDECLARGGVPGGRRGRLLPFL